MRGVTSISFLIFLLILISPPDPPVKEIRIKITIESKRENLLRQLILLRMLLRVFRRGRIDAPPLR